MLIPPWLKDLEQTKVATQPCAENRLELAWPQAEIPSAWLMTFEMAWACPHKPMLAGWTCLKLRLLDSLLHFVQQKLET